MTERIVELGSGTGVVAVIGGVALFVADQDAAERLVEAARGAVAGLPADRPPGRALARRLGALVGGDDAGRVPAFGAIAALEDGWAVLLHGAVMASIVTAEGTEEQWSGESSVTWADRTVPTTTRAVLIAPVELARPGASLLRLEAGVVPGGWLRLVAAASLPSANADFIEPPATFEPSTAEGSQDANGTAGSAEGVTTVEPSPGELLQDRQRPSLGLLVFDDGATFGLDDDYVLGREPEIDDAVTAGTARPIALDDPADTVSRVHAEIRLVASDVQLIDRGSKSGTHLWDESRGIWDRLTPGLPRVIRPGERGAVGRRTFVYEAGGGPVAPPARQARETVAVGPDRVGALTGAHGAVYPLDRAYVIGRDPLSDDTVREALASPIVIRDDQHVSRVHAYVSVVDGAVEVRDAGTTGGTFIAAPGAASWQPVGPKAAELPPGWSLRVGANVLTYRIVW